MADEKPEAPQVPFIVTLSDMDLLNMIRLCEVGISDVERVDKIYGNVELVQVRNAISSVQSKCDLELKARQAIRERAEAEAQKKKPAADPPAPAAKKKGK